MKNASKVILGIFWILVSHAFGATHYVNLVSTNPTPPYTNWATAAITIQDAVDAADVADLVMVMDGVYRTGGRVVYGSMTNRVVVTNAITLRSLHGPAQTRIDGFQAPGTTNGDTAVRCVYLSSGASLDGFALTLGATRSSGETVNEQSGGALWCEPGGGFVSDCWIYGNVSAYGGGGVYRGMLSRCALSNNAVIAGRAEGGGAWASYLISCMLVSNTAFIGGGAYQGALENCLLVGNSAGYGGGGAAGGALAGCTLINNSAIYVGGGIYGGTAETFAYNCIIYYNSPVTFNPWLEGTANFCCKYPAAPGEGNITNAPRFVNLAGGDLRLQPDSPCINSGNTSLVGEFTDFAGNQRIRGGTVDIGAYEFQFPTSGISYAWLLQYGFALDGSADYLDPDNDGMTNWQEWRAGTDPTNAASALRMLTALPIANPPGVAVMWESVSNRSYFLQRASGLAQQPTFTTVQPGIAGQAGTTSFLDTNAPRSGPLYYQVGVH